MKKTTKSMLRTPAMIPAAVLDGMLKADGVCCQTFDTFRSRVVEAAQELMTQIDTTEYRAAELAQVVEKVREKVKGGPYAQNLFTVILLNEYYGVPVYWMLHAQSQEAKEKRVHDNFREWLKDVAARENMSVNQVLNVILLERDRSVKKAN